MSAVENKAGARGAPTLNAERLTLNVEVDEQCSMTGGRFT